MSKINLSKLLSRIIEDDLSYDARAKICLFLGAGCSISSGADSFMKLKNRIIHNYALEESEFYDELKYSNNIENFFDVLFEKITNPQTRISIVKDAFPEKKVPADGYICAALLCSAGVVNSIITTNFDQYLEQAAKSIGSMEDIYVIHTLVEPDVESLQRISKKKTIVYKIHGDLDMGIVSLTSSELNDGTYPLRTIQLAKFLMCDQRIIFSGYSGSEKRLTRFFEQHINKNGDIRIPEIYWINPTKLTTNHPLFETINKKLIQDEQSDKAYYFDNFMKDLIRNLDPRLFVGKTKAFRPYEVYRFEIYKQTQKCLDVQSYLSLNDPRYVKRKDLINAIIDDCLNSKHLLMLPGPSGYGKSSLIPALIDSLSNLSDASTFTVCLKVGGEFRPRLSFEDVFAQSLGIENVTIPNLTLVESDLERNKASILVIIDGIDQARASIDETKLFFRDISRFHSALFEEGIERIKILITCRSEVWKAISNRKTSFKIDLKNINEIEIGRYSREDAAYAFQAYSDYFNITASLKGVSPETSTLLREPILLRLICSAYQGKDLPLSLKLHQIFETYLRSCLDKHQDYDVLPFLEKLATNWLDPRIARDGCSSFDLPRVDFMGSLLDIALRSGILKETQKNGMDYYNFFHERILELFIFRYLMSYYENGLALIKFNHDDLIETITQHAESKHIRNVIKLFLTSPRTRRILGKCIVSANQITRDIICECIFMVSQSDPDDYSEYFIDWYFSVSDSKLKGVLIQAAAGSHKSATKLWEIIEHESSQTSSLTLSAIYFLVDTHRQEIEKKRHYKITIDHFQKYFFVPCDKPNLSALLCLYLIARCEPHKLSEITTRSLYDSAIAFISCELKKTKEPQENILEFNIERYGPRYLFNSGLSDLQKFLNRSIEERQAFNSIIELIANIPEQLDEDLCKLILSFTHENNARIEKLLLQPIFILIARIDFKSYKKIITQLLTISRTRSEADFCSGSVAYQYAANDQFEHDFSYAVNEFSLKEHPDFLRFEESYEILFNPIATYGFTYSLIYKNEAIDLFEKYIDLFLRQKDHQMILRMLHALRQTLALAPDEGLKTIKPILRCKDAVVRQRIVRILTEGYAICPSRVSKFIYSNEDMISTEEMRAIFTEEEHNLHQHPITILEWGRVYRFLLYWNDSTEDWKRMLTLINNANSLQGIAQAIISTFSGRHIR